MVGVQESAPRRVRRAAETRDLSPEAVSRAVLATTLQKPYVLYPAAVTILGLVAALALGPVSWFLIPAALGGVVGLGAWAYDYFVRRDQYASDYLRRLTETLYNRRVQVVKDLEGELGEAGLETGRAQLRQLQDKFHAFMGLLDKKLDPHELTYGRYLGMAEQVFLATLDNLRRVVDTSAGIRAIDSRHAGQRILTLERDPRLSDAERQELDSLRQRVALKMEQEAKVEAWLSQNEQAMTQMDLAMAAIAAMDTVRGEASTDLETAMAAMADLARRASAYNMGNSGAGGPGA